MDLQWHYTKDGDLPTTNEQVLVYSPVYPVEHVMRFGIVNGQFVKLCLEVERWAYLEETVMR